MKHVIEYAGYEAHVQRVPKESDIVPGVPDHEQIGVDGRKGVSALMDLMNDNIAALKDYCKSCKRDEKTELLEKRLKGADEFQEKMVDKLQFNFWLNDNKRMNFGDEGEVEHE